ncbi:hypothetical protein [Desulfuribacillus alkaliarsenatis]|uniref:Uncharacterized protein n=1 Tax=Desulfuribacillus alkaliarsenatis TaxID=766136 RepID=A0A1E5G138_9FIRM|nr:hypothetical protein [Desulfuribacillus alkaliarsenatis]OEF96613.1 hypothetical protein BHF68_08195 [Desulfuribacillus alkaliarsenatis]
MALIMPIFLIVIFIAALFLIRFSVNNMGGFNFERVRWLLAGYTVLLLIAIAIFYMLPKDQFIQQDIISGSELASEEYYSHNFYEIAKQGKLEESEGIIRNGQWSFDYNDDLLRITDSQGMPANVWIMAERSEDLEGEIQIYSYTTRTILRGIDLTEDIKAPNVRIEGNRLIIQEALPYELYFANFKQEYVIGQFLTSSPLVDTNYNANRAIFGSRMLLVKVPANLEVEHGEYGIEFIN